MKKNIIPMILPHLQRATLFIASACLFLLAGCTDHNDDLISGNQNDQSKMTIVITVPGAQLPTTRGMADGKGEESVEEIDILVFDRTVSPEKLVENVAVSEADIQQSTDGGTDYKVVFKAALSSRATASRLVIVANAHDQVTTMLGAISSEKTKKEVMENLLFATTGTGESRKWKSIGKSSGNPEGDFTPIPMYAEKEVSNIQAGTQIESIALQRMLARIDVLNSATTKFTLEKIHLVNYNLTGYIAPAWDEDNGNLLATAPDDPYIPGSANAQTGATNALAYTYTHSPTGYEGEIYTYESVAAKDGTTNDLGRKNATCLVFEGKMVGDATNTPHFYRVDFAQYQETISDPDNIPYIPLRRNYKYKVDIQAVEGIGYGSLVDAINSYTMVSNLKTRIIAYDQGVIKDVVYDGQYMLGVEEGEYELAREINKVKVNVFTDSPKGWKATIQADDESWLTFDGNNVTSVTGACGDSNASLTFRTTTFKGTGNRTAKIVVTAGRLIKEINVTQTDENRLWIRITDEDGNPITKVEYYNIQGVTKLKPMKIFVSWGGTDAMLTYGEKVSHDIGYFEFDGKYDQMGGDPYTGNYKVFTIMANESARLASYNDSRTMKTIQHFRLREPSGGEWDYTDSYATLEMTYTVARELVHYPFVGAFWRWNQSGERLIRLEVPPGEWRAEVTKGADFIRLDTESSTDPNLWRTGLSPADMNLDTNDAKHRLSDKAKTKIGGTAIALSAEKQSNLYFRIGLTGPHPAGSNAGLTGSATPRYGEVLVTHPGGTRTIYIRQGESAAELIEGSGVYWSPYNMSDPQRGTGGNDIAGHLDVQTGETYFMPEKFTDYPSQVGYFFQWNRVKAYHPTAPNTYVSSSLESHINGWTGSFESTWNKNRDVCPKGYRYPTGKVDDQTGDFFSGLFENAPQLDNSIWGYYADGFFDRIKLEKAFVEEYYNSDLILRGGNGSEAAYVGRLFFDTGTSASLFFPANGYRETSAGRLSSEALNAVYCSDVGGFINFKENAINLYTTSAVGYGLKIRCVKGEKQ